MLSIETLRYPAQIGRLCEIHRGGRGSVRVRPEWNIGENNIASFKLSTAGGNGHTKSGTTAGGREAAIKIDRNGHSFANRLA